MTSKYETSHTSQGCGGYLQYHSTLLTKTFRIYAIYFKDVHLLFFTVDIDLQTFFTLSHTPL
jgi:hypothetical protein